MNDFVSKRKTAERTRNFEHTLLRQLLTPLSTTFDPSIPQPWPTPIRKHVPRTRSCLQSNQLVDKPVLKNGTLLEARTDLVFHHGIRINADYEE
jgi:hypothetical protein